MKDISVSRNHCTLVYNNGKFIVENKGSKFGTVYYTKSNKCLKYNKQTAGILAGKTLINFEMNVKWSIMNIFSCCNTKTNDYECSLASEIGSNFPNYSNNLNYFNKMNNFNNDYENSVHNKFDLSTRRKGNDNNDKQDIELCYSNTANNINNINNTGKELSCTNFNNEDSIADNVLLIDNLPYFRDKEDKLATTQNNSFI